MGGDAAIADFPSISEGSTINRLHHLQVRTVQDVMLHCGVLRCTGSAVEYALALS